MAKVHYAIRKTSHFVEYVILAVLLYRALRLEIPSAAEHRKIILTILIGALYAASDELHQEFVKGREARLGDVLIDTSGATVGVLAYYTTVRRRKPA